ncbi:MAG: hypothetical protein EI684_16125 [Candidatus Viridilinea halotolerans]|uniref:DUF7948 domain-containing protein n=1 Tax=Candidatus Viridilinea halotolerans TaxID=2491704 RepID=A0A426TV33_9CHLR|nr:MAG: hypothetical protein EI684_16125 [Candidatus Viridilinea halotolerans]
MYTPAPRPFSPSVLLPRSLAVFLMLFALLALLPFQLTRVQPLAPVAPPAAAPVVVPDFGRMPLLFVANQGQSDPQVDYYVQGSDKTLFFTSQGVTIVLPGEQSAPLDPREQTVAPASDGPAHWVVKLDFVGARPDVQPVGEQRAETIISYFKGRPDEWHTAIPTFGRLVYPELWPGIDLVYYGSAERLKYEFIVQPGADPSQIRLAYRGASGVTLNEAGQLVVTTGIGSFSDAAPVSYQELDGERRAVATSYALAAPAADGSVSYGFALGAYDPAQPLVIDPEMIVYAGFIGGSGIDEGNGIAVDAAGHAYVTGRTLSSEASFPVTIGPDLTFNGGFRGGDAFVAKIAADGSGLIYAGYIGGSGVDEGFDIAVDAAGNAYVTGRTGSSEASFPVTIGPDLTYNGSDAFVAKVAADGSRLVYAGYLGGSNIDSGSGIAVDAAGHAYVTGYTYSSEAEGFPVTIGPDLTYNGSGDAFVAKVKADGTGFVYAGYIGGSGGDGSGDIAVDGSGHAYVTGSTDSSEEGGFPATVGPDLTFNDNHNSGDAFVAKVRADGRGLVYAGYIGGMGGDYGRGIAVDEAGHAYVTGYTYSSEASFPVMVGPDLTYNRGEGDAFVAKVAADGSGLVYAGFIGGALVDRSNSIAVDAAGHAYVTGYTDSRASFPATVGPDLTYNGGYDAFVAKVTADGSGLVYAGYLGGSAVDEGNGIAVDAAGNVYVTGWTYSSEASFPVTIGPDLAYNGSNDAFVAKIAPYSGPTLTSTNAATGAPGSYFGFAVSGLPPNRPVAVSLTAPAPALAATATIGTVQTDANGGASFTVFFAENAQPGAYTVTVSADDASASTQVTVATSAPRLADPDHGTVLEVQAQVQVYLPLVVR